MKFKIIDSQNNHQPIKGGFLTEVRAHKWCKKNLPEGSWRPWGSLGLTRYYIMGYNK